MADVPQAIAEKAKPVSGGDGAPGFNLVDLAAPGAADKQTRPRPAPDADLNHGFVRLDPSAWDNSAALRKIYENGVFKLLADPDGKQQFGVRISDQKTDRLGIVPLRGGHLNEKGVSLEFQLKF